MAPKHWSHERTHFYKYMTADTAKVVLQNNTLRWSSPALFNDPFDVQFDLHIEYDRDSAAERAMSAILNGYSGRVPIAQGNALGRMLALVRQHVPALSEADMRNALMPDIYEGMARAEKRLPQTHREMRAAISDLKLLCLSEIHDNILMWAHYAKDHTGVVLELSCIEHLDSAWGAAKPVKYRENMPLLVDEEKFVGLMAGETRIADPEVFENSVFVKARDWAYEKEWRLVGGRDASKKIEDVPFYVEEISSAYLGCRINDEDAMSIRDIINRKYPYATVYLGKKSEKRFALEFTKVQ